MGSAVDYHCPSCGYRVNGPLGFVSLRSGAVLVSGRLRETGSSALGRLAWALSLILLPAILWMAVSIATATGSAGLAQRVLLAILAVWYVTVGAHLHGAEPGI